MINFIVCGLEDILIRKGVREIEDDTIDMIAQLLENNVRFAVATGLNYDSVKPLFGKVQNAIIYICNDGGTIIYEDKVISKTDIDRLVCMDVIAEMEKEPFVNDIRLVFSTEREAIVSDDNQEIMNALKEAGITARTVENLRTVYGCLLYTSRCV